MKNIEINISNKIATLKEKFVGVCGNSDYVVVFDFDDEWKSHTTKTARFKYNGKYEDVVFSGNECPMPIILDTASVEIGVYAGNLHTTTSACVLMKTCILSGSGVPADPIPDVYNQIIDKIDAGMLKGEDGVSPSVEVSKSGDTTTIAITDAFGVHTAEIKDGSKGGKGDKGDKGEPGAPGKDGSDANVTAENIKAALGYAPVKDVQVAGTSVMTDGVANVPIASETGAGVVSIPFPVDSGIWNDKGRLKISYATDSEISTRYGHRKTIVCTNLDYAVKAAMCDGKGAAWNRDEKNAAQRRAGINELYELIEEFDLSEASTFERTEEPNGTPFAFIDVITQIIVPTNTSLTAGEFYVQAKNIAGNFITVGRGYMSGKSSGNARMGYTQRTRIRRGYWESEWGDWTTNLSAMNFNSGDTYNFWLKFKESEYKAINKIYETSVLPAGTHIRIFGVRA